MMDVRNSFTGEEDGIGENVLLANEIIILHGVTPVIVARTWHARVPCGSTPSTCTCDPGTDTRHVRTRASQHVCMPCAHHCIAHYGDA